MNNNYRENAFAPNEIRRRDDDYYDNVRQISECVSQKFHGMSKSEYLNWRANWKSTYADISDCIRWLKKQPAQLAWHERTGAPLYDTAYADMGTVQSDLKAYQKLANTLLNAREFAKTVRRKEGEKRVS